MIQHLVGNVGGHIRKRWLCTPDKTHAVMSGLDSGQVDPILFIGGTRELPVREKICTFP